MYRISLGWVALAGLAATAWLATTAGHRTEVASAQLAEVAPIRAQLETLVRSANLGDRVGVHVARVSDGSELFSSHGDLALNPASNMKLVTAAGALLELGPAFTMRTALYGRVEDGRVDPLVLQGFGDPSLSMADLVVLAEELADRGVSRVGTVVVDGRYFDDAFLPPAFEQQPDEVAAFRAAIAAVSVDRSAYVVRVIPTTPGEAARVRLAASGYFDLESTITTADGGAPNVIAIQSGDGPRMQLRLRGTVPAGILGVSYRRRVENPSHYAGHALIAALARADIPAGGEVRVAGVGGGVSGGGVSAGVPEGLPLLTYHESAALSELLFPLGKQSDNFTAEMLLKVLGAERRRPGSSAGGAEVIEGVLERAGVPRGGATLVNGSGLFEGNRIAPSHLTRLLRYMHTRPNVRAEYLAHLAVGGRDGTLARRFGDRPEGVTVRAKTGTLNDVIALSGYVEGPDPDATIAFSLLCNGIRGRQGEARRLTDQIVTALAQSLAR
jgi:D-alanyl-D-alanine carboxypeptidase/D-alanyl-D-alanine-endopeptidase (penicillin-binding protein 4)